MVRSRKLASPAAPPLLSGLSFDEAETDALIFGLCLAARLADADADADEAAAAERALDRISAALPPEPPRIDLSSGGQPVDPVDPGHAATILRAIREERRLDLSYVDRTGRASSRTISPIAFGMIGEADSVAAWCGLRGDFRRFRLDRMRSLVLTDRPFHRRRRILVAAWRASELENEFW